MTKITRDKFDIFLFFEHERRQDAENKKKKVQISHRRTSISPSITEDSEIRWRSMNLTQPFFTQLNIISGKWFNCRILQLWKFNQIWSESVSCYRYWVNSAAKLLWWHHWIAAQQYYWLSNRAKLIRETSLQWSLFPQSLTPIANDSIYTKLYWYA